MVQRSRFWATALGTAALIALPIITTALSDPSGSGQSTSGQSTTGQSTSGMSAGQSTSTDHSATGASGQESPQYHLDQAKSALDSISNSGLNAGAGAVISRLMSQFSTLYNDYQKSGSSGTSRSATTGTSGSSSPPSISSDWDRGFSRIENELDSLSIPRSSYAPSVNSSGLW